MVNPQVVKIPGRYLPKMSKGKAAIVGSGIVGRSWALIFARGGYNVNLYDTNLDQITAAVEAIRQSAETLHTNDLLFGQSVEDVMALIEGQPDLNKAIEGAIYAQECTPESVKIKSIVFNNLDKAATETKNTDIILASSSSNIYPSQFTSELKMKANCLVAHPVNPPFAIPVVEVVPAPHTDPKVTERARALLKEVGMAPVVLKKEIDGFLVNRLQYAMLQEAYRLVEDGVASPQDIDTAVSQGLGLRWSFMGPFQTIDLNAPEGVNDYAERYSSSVCRVVKSQDNSRCDEWDKKVVKQIHDAMREEVPADKLAERLQWRNNRLVELAVLKQKQNKRDAEGKEAKTE